MAKKIAQHEAHEFTWESEYYGAVRFNCPDDTMYLVTIDGNGQQDVGLLSVEAMDDLARKWLAYRGEPQE